MGFGFNIKMYKRQNPSQPLLRTSK